MMHRVSDQMLCMWHVLKYRGGELTVGACLAIASARVLTMPALMLNRSSRVMPGFLGTPAGIMTRSAPLSASGRDSGPVWPVTCARA